MNWKAIVILSGFGVAMSMAFIFGLIGGSEALFRLFCGVLSAIWLVLRVPDKHFMHGLKEN